MAMDPVLHPSTNPERPQPAVVPRPAPPRRLSRGRISAHITGQGRREFYQLLELLPGAARGLFYAVANLGSPTNLVIRQANRVILETGFGLIGGRGWLPLPEGPTQPVEVIVISRGACIDSQVEVRGLDAPGEGLTIADGAILVAAGRRQRGLLQIPVRLGAPAAETVNVRWRTLAGTASDGRSGSDRADFRADAGVLTFRPGEQTRVIEIPVFGDTPINAGADNSFEIFARDIAYNNQIQKRGLDVDQLNKISYYGDLGYRVNRTFQGSDGFQAVGLTASEEFYLIVSHPNALGVLTKNHSEGERLLTDLKESFGGNSDSPAYQQAQALVQELESSDTAWRFATATIHDAGRAPVLAIRGTEPTRELADVWTDLHPFGIGADQYRNNRSELLAWLEEVSRPRGLETTLAPHITGHSLGGALAQWLAADAAFSGRLGDVVTFNAPGISRNAAAGDHSNLTGVRHYITSTDIVSLAGEALLPGRTLISDVPGSFLDQTPISGPHLHPVLVPSLSNGSLRPAGLVQRETNAVNHPLFSYLPDPDYLLFLLAVARIPGVGPGLAATLVSRSGVEQARALIGEELVSAAGRYRLGRAMAEAVSGAAASWSHQAWESLSQWSAAAWAAASQWDSQAWERTRRWNPEAWNATRFWNDLAWAATGRWSAAAWDAAARWGNQAWQATVQWLNDGKENGLDRQESNAPVAMTAMATTFAAPGQTMASQPSSGRDQLVPGSSADQDLRSGNRGVPADEDGDGLLIAGAARVPPEKEAPALVATLRADPDGPLILNLTALEGLSLAPLTTPQPGSTTAPGADGRASGDGQDGALRVDQATLGDADLLIPGSAHDRRPPSATAVGPTAAIALRISQSVEERPIAPGDLVTLTTLIENPSSQDCLTTELQLQLPPGVIVLDTETGIHPAEASRRTIALGPLAAGQQRSLALTLQLPDGTMTASYPLRTWASGIPDGHRSDRAATGLPSDPAIEPAVALTLRVEPPRLPDLIVTRDQGDNIWDLHQPFASNRVIQNRGTAAAEGVILTEWLPSGMTLESLEGADVLEAIDGALRLELGTLQPGERRSVWMTLSSRVAGTLTGHSQVSSRPGDDADPFNNVASNAFRIAAAIPPRTDLQLTLETSDAAPTVGDRVTLSATLSNEGPGDAAGPLVALSCPAGLQLEAIEAERGSYDPATGLWEVGSLGLGTSTVLRLTGRVQQEGLWLTTAEVVDQADLDRDSDPGNGRPGEDDQATIAIRASRQKIVEQQMVQGPRRLVAEPSGPIEIPLSASDPWGANRVEGGNLAVHFDSRALRFERISQSLRPLAQAPTIEEDHDDSDGNPATDRRLLLRWQDQRRAVSGLPGVTPLITVNVLPMAGFTDTLIGLSTRDTIAGLGFTGHPIAVRQRPWTLDIDGDGHVHSNTDGALLLRYAFGYGPQHGPIHHLTGAGARRRSAEAIDGHLQQGIRSGALDLDGNGRFEPLTDGLMILRFIDDIVQGEELTAGALAADATITSSDFIRAHLQRLTTLL